MKMSLKKISNLYLKKIPQQKLKIVSIFSTLSFFILAHGYRFSNLLFSHDSLNVCEYKPEWELGIGRFMHPVLYVIRGVLGAPWLFSILSILWLSLSVLLVIKIFNIDSLWAVIATPGIMVCNNVITLSNATYIQWMDVYTLALFTAVLAAWLLLKVEVNKLIQIRNYILVAVLVAISMGLYQAYIGVTIGIIVFSYILKLGNHEAENSIKSLFIGIIKSSIPILVGGILYFVLWKAILALSGIISQNYFGMDESSSAKGYAYALYRTYKNVAIFFRRPSLYNTGSVIGTKIIEFVIVMANIIVLAVLGLYPIANYFSSKKKQINSKSEGIIRLVLQYILLAILPFAVNFACFMTKGDEHDLMRYGMVMIYIYALTIICNIKFDKQNWTIRANTILLICLSIVIWSNIVFSNQLYLKKSLQEEATNYKIGRLVEMIEKTAESADLERPYKVIIVGNASDNDYFNDIKDTEMLGGTGIYNSPITYGRTIGFYTNYMLGADMDVYLLDKDDNFYLVGDNETNWNPSPISNQELDDVPVFPSEDSVVYLKNYIIVKMSDTDMVY